MEKTKEIRFHSRGGLGLAVTTRIVVAAFGAEGKYGSGLPSFGVERRGSPVIGYVRLDDKPIREKSRVYHPECLVIMDPFQMDSPQTFEGLKENSTMVLDASQMPETPPDPNIKKIVTVDATSIALEELGDAITNCVMLGAFGAGTGWLKLDSILGVLDQFFRGEILKKNLKCAERGYKEIQIKTW